MKLPFCPNRAARRSPQTEGKMQDNMQSYADWDNLALRADPEWQYGEEWIAHQGGHDARHLFTVPGVRTSEWLGLLADAAQVSNRSRQYSVPLVENWHGFIQRAIIPLLEKLNRARRSKNWKFQHWKK